MPQISLDPYVRYVTQSSVWSNHLKGRLTDRQIEKYRVLGYYGSGMKSSTEKVKQKKKEKKRQTIKDLFKGFV